MGDLVGQKSIQMKLKVLFFAVLLLLSLQNYAQKKNNQSKTVKKAVVENHTNEITITPFPIMSFIPPALTKHQLDWFKEAGFNVMFIHPDEEDYGKLKKYWNGNFMLFKDFTSKGYDYKTMCDFKTDDPKNIGYVLGDEPRTVMIDTYKEQYDYLRSRHPDKICLVNMLPSYANEVYIGSTYRSYMRKYFEKLHPSYASLDNYPCNRFNWDGKTYYHDLEMMRETAQENNCKVFGFVQVYSSDASRDVSESDLSWQVNSLLAYGAKGLWYFYFRNPVPAINELMGKEFMKINKKDSIYNFNLGRVKVSTPENVYEFGSGVLTMDDQKGERFNDVAKVNAETLAWGDILIQLKSVKVRHILAFNEAYPPVGVDNFGSKSWSGAEESLITRISAKDQTQSMGYILSYFENPQNQQYVMIVNKNHGENMTRKEGSLSTLISFTKDVKNIYSVSNIDGKEKKIELNGDSTCEFEMEGGSAILLRLEINK